MQIQGASSTNALLADSLKVEQQSHSWDNPLTTNSLITPMHSSTNEGRTTSQIFNLMSILICHNWGYIFTCVLRQTILKADRQHNGFPMFCHLHDTIVQFSPLHCCEFARMPSISHDSYQWPLTYALWVYSQEELKNVLRDAIDTPQVSTLTSPIGTTKQIFLKASFFLF